MKLVSFQTREAVSLLQKTGILTADIKCIDLKKYGMPYNWIVHEMNKQKIYPQNNEKYPIWAWSKCGSTIAPRKRKNYFKEKQDVVKVTFEKTDNEVLLSDYMAYSFILSGHIVPKTRAEYQYFIQKTKENGISLERLKEFVRNEKSDEKVTKLFSKIEKTWSRIFNLKSTVHQACIWNIKLSEVINIEVLDNPEYIYGMMNTKRLDGSRPDWKKKYLKFLPD